MKYLGAFNLKNTRTPYEKKVIKIYFIHEDLY